MASHVSAYSAASSALYQSTIASTGIQRETFGDRLTQTRYWLYNPEDGTVMGRTPVDWVIYIICIIVFLLALLGFSAVFCGIFYWVIDWNYPTLQGGSSILQLDHYQSPQDTKTCYTLFQNGEKVNIAKATIYNNTSQTSTIYSERMILSRTSLILYTPGMSFRPQPHIGSTLIRFLKGDITTYTHLLDHIEAYIMYYENELQVGDRYKDCNEIRKRRTDELDKVCVFDPIVLGGDCVKQQNYGFDDGQPCILLKLNKIFDWVPEEYTPETVPALIKDNWDENDPWWIHVRCDGDDDATRENMGDLSYFPQQGFHFKYFPFRNQQGYRSPLMFLRFENPHPGILLMMTCRAFARNIIHDRVEQVGQVHFELIVD